MLAKITKKIITFMIMMIPRDILIKLRDLSWLFPEKEIKKKQMQLP